MVFAFILIGAILAVGLFDKPEFSLLGGVIGYLFFRLKQQSHLLSSLKQEISNLKNHLEQSKKQTSKTQVRASDEQPLVRESTNRQAEQEKPLQDEFFHVDSAKNQSGWPKNLHASEWQQEQAPSSVNASSIEVDRKTTDRSQRTLFDSLIDKITDYFTQGNIVVRVGAVILFFGVSFLLKYAAENSLVPIELRLTSVLLGAIALLIFGWRFKDKNQNYGLILQGTAIGILYLTLFAAFRIYQLIPAGLAFPLLIVFSALAMTLAVLQNAKALAVLSVTGGFLAPVLTSTGAGSHIALFSYYAVLNSGIIFVAWFKAWRLLNLCGFLFTFIIGTAWGALKYQPSDFASTEPFLILFFLIYCLVSILFAWKFKSNIKGYVDSTLVFGLPVISFSLQAAMVSEMNYGLAWSAMAIGGFYLSTAFFILKYASQQLKLLAEAFIALGIIFTSLVIPFALDSQWTAAAWAIEGAGLVWLGLRQQRAFAKYFGSLIQLVGGLLFIPELEFKSATQLVIDAQLLGIFLVAIAALFSAYQCFRHHKQLTQVEAKASLGFLIWGLCWWYLGGFSELSQLKPNLTELNSYVIFISLSGLVWHLLFSRFQWQIMIQLVWISLPLLYLTGLGFTIDYHHLFTGWSALYWSIAIALFYWILLRQDRQAQGNRSISPIAAQTSLHLVALIGLILLSMIELDWLTVYWQFKQTSWAVALFGLLAIGWLMAIIKVPGWPCQRFIQTYQINALSLVSFGLIIWSIFFNFPHHGDPNPLSYIPLVNPLDIVQGLSLLVIYLVVQRQKQHGLHQSNSWLIVFGGCLIFCWLNIVLLRSLHNWSGVAYQPEALFSSPLVQTSVAIFWTLLGLFGAILSSGTILSRRFQSRELWIYSAGLLAAVVLKLFIIDLANTSSIERIVSFVVVGLLLLIIGYFSPMPEKKLNQENKEPQVPNSVFIVKDTKSDRERATGSNQ